MVHRTEAGRTPEEVKAKEGALGLGYHYFVDGDGNTHRLAPDTQLLWHARAWSRGMLGVAVYGCFLQGEGIANQHPTGKQLFALENLCLALWHRYGPLPILGHTDLPHGSHDPLKVCPGPNLDVAALARDVAVNYGLARLARRLGDDAEVPASDWLC